MPWTNEFSNPLRVSRYFPNGLPELRDLDFRRIVISNSGAKVVVAFNSMPWQATGDWSAAGYEFIDLVFTLNEISGLDCDYEWLFSANASVEIKLSNNMFEMVTSTKTVLSLEFNSVEAEFLPDPHYDEYIKQSLKLESTIPQENAPWQWHVANIYKGKKWAGLMKSRMHQKSALTSLAQNNV